MPDYKYPSLNDREFDLLKKLAANTAYIAENGTGGGGGGSGTVTTVSVASANGFAGSVASPTTTPIITLRTTITGMLKGNGTALLLAVADTDYQSAISFGANVRTALGVAIGSAGAPILFNGNAGTPSALVGTNITGTASGLTAGSASAVALGGITGLGSGVATFLATPSGANLASALTTALPITKGGTGGTTAATARVALNTTTSAIGASAIDWNLGTTFSKTLGANTTFTFSNDTDGMTVTVALTNTASNYTVTWPGGVLWSGGTPPVQTIGAKTDIYSFKKIGSTVYGSVIQNF